MRRRIALGVAITVQFALLLVAAPPAADRARRPDIPATPVARTPRFHFARLRYPGGIPGYIKNWYTDYPNMDSHLTMLTGRMTNIDVGDPDVVDSDSPDIFKYPLIYSVEPEQMDLA